ncbi:MAG TPA: permease [Candidatus Limnocylindrales bacterium]|nr:permease [Candidatus Limnocylindrales bacterium]
MTSLAVRRLHLPFWPTAIGAAVAWLVAWFINLPAANWLAYDVLGLERGEHLGDAIAFFLYDVPKVLLLLLGIVTAVTFLRSYFPPERMRAALAGRGTLPATIGAAGFGVVTPFCSCSAVPLFIGFVEAGIPMGVTFAFLISSPMVNEVALVLLWGLFGPGIALLYMAAGLSVAIVGGLILGRLGVERWVEPWVRDIRASGGATQLDLRLSLEQRLRDAWTYTKDLVRKVLPYVLVGIGVGAFIHGFVPTDLVAQIGGRENPLAVPIVVLIAIPLYSNAAGTIPIVEALLGKGLPLGTTLAFMMAIVAISLPEFLILRRVIRVRLIALFASVVVAGILAVGLLFNALGL